MTVGGVLLCLSGLVCRLSARVPEADDMDGVVINAVHQLVQAINDNAAICLCAVLIQRVYLADIRAALQAVGGFTNLLLEFVLALGAKLAANIVGNLVTLPSGTIRPFHSHKASICSFCSSASSRSYSSSSSLRRSSSSITFPAAMSASASSSMALSSAFV